MPFPVPSAQPHGSTILIFYSFLLTHILYHLYIYNCRVVARLQCRNRKLLCCRWGDIAHWRFHLLPQKVWRGTQAVPSDCGRTSTSLDCTLFENDTPQNRLTTIKSQARRASKTVSKLLFASFTISPFRSIATLRSFRRQWRTLRKRTEERKTIDNYQRTSMHQTWLVNLINYYEQGD